MCLTISGSASTIQPKPLSASLRKLLRKGMGLSRFGPLAASLAIAAIISVQGGGTAPAQSCTEQPTFDSLISAVFGANPIPCDLNGDGAVSGADLLAAI